LREEKIMLDTYGEEYEKYRSKTPFMIPIPKALGRIITLPVKLFFKKIYPEKIIEITLIVGIYFAVILTLSILY